MRHTVASRRRTLLFVLVAATTSIHCGGDTAPKEPPTMSILGGDGQSAAYGTAVTILPSVKLADASGNGVSGVSVTFAVASGGGTVTGPTKTTGKDGIASVGAWNLGTALGPNTLTATATGATGSPVTFTATAVAGPAATMA